MNASLSPLCLPRSTTNPTPLDDCVSAFCASEGLSPQETVVVSWAARGLSDKQIACELRVSRSTVGTYWQRIYDKLRVQGQREVLALILQFSTNLHREGLPTQRTNVCAHAARACAHVPGTVS
jgi:DNA-binding CsgD family transcriptional regulator